MIEESFLDIVVLIAIVGGIYYFLAKKKMKKEETKKSLEKSFEHYRHGMYPTRIEQKEEIKILHAAGKGEQFLKNVERRVEKANFPNKVTWTREIMYFDKEQTKSQEFLVFVNDLKEVKGWKMFVGAKDWGDVLEISWYLMTDVFDMPNKVMPKGKTDWQNNEIKNFGGMIAAIVTEEADRIRDGLPFNTSKNNDGDNGFMSIS